MTSALIFSKDRACQLDLLLRSVTCNAPDLLNRVSVLWAASNSEYADGYARCFAEHEWVEPVRERDFFSQTLDILDLADDHHTFFTDDSVLYRDLAGLTDPAKVLEWGESVICFSLRLGWHTGTCYPLRRLQGLPALKPIEDILVWEWRTGDADWGYMGSLDGHIFRKSDLMDWLDGTRCFRNPNQLEDVLVSEVAGCLRSTAACYHQSHLVGVPVNRVNETHLNRFGDYHERFPDELNKLYLEGRRVSLDSIKADRITAAHAEMEFTFE